MKILQVFDFFSPHGGGTVDIVYKLSRTLAENGHEVAVFTSDYKLDQKYIDSLPQVRVFPLHCIINLAGFYIIPGMIREVRKKLKDFDIIHLNCFRSLQNIVIHHYARQYKIPYILETRGSLPRKAAGETGLKWLLRWLFDVIFGYRILNDAAVVVASNKFGANEHNEFGVKDERIAVIPLFFAVDDFTHLPPAGQFRSQYGIDGKHIVMFLGRIHQIKGLSFLVESFYELTKLRSDVVLAIVGPDDGYQSKLESLVKRLKLSNQVLFTGFLGGKDKLAALVDADVVVQPSKYEQASWAPIEAVLCGTPIIVSKNTGSGEDVSRMDAGYLVEHGDKKALVSTIQSILDDPTEARDKVRRATEFLEKNLSLSSKIVDYEKLYTECIQEAKHLRSEK